MLCGVVWWLCRGYAPKGRFVHEIWGNLVVVAEMLPGKLFTNSRSFSSRIRWCSCRSPGAIYGGLRGTCYGFWALINPYYSIPISEAMGVSASKRAVHVVLLDGMNSQQLNLQWPPGAVACSCCFWSSSNLQASQAKMPSIRLSRG